MCSSDLLLLRRRDDLNERGVRVRFIGRRGGRVPKRVLRHITDTHGANAVAAYVGNPTAFNALGSLHTTTLLRALGITGRVKSPTYAVVEPHEAPDGLAIFHFDCYRFNDPQEWDDAGFRDIFIGPGLKLVEWPDNARSRLPPCDIAIHIETMIDDTRTVTLHANTPRGIVLLAAATS